MRSIEPQDHAAVNAVRILAIDQVEKACSGHPGLPLGAAPMAYVLWSRFLKHDPTNPMWPNRDRFVLSAGHGSALVYALLHLFGYELPISELEQFRQWGSRTPGHPEHGHTVGVETTTGPLGQGLANAIGMALAERHMAARFNRDDFTLFCNRTWVLASDGDLMEGISHEAASLAGHLRLGNLKVLYDDNHITIEGSTSLAFSEDVGKRFESYGWRVLHVDDGNDLEELARAMTDASSDDTRPVLIRVRTHIGFGSPKQDSAAVHGSPLGAEAAEATRKKLGWESDIPFFVPAEIYAHFASFKVTGSKERHNWEELFSRFQQTHPELAAELQRRWRGELLEGWDVELPSWPVGSGLATREASGAVLNALAKKLPELLGGSADLAPSNNTRLTGETDFSTENYSGRNIHFGVREHAMGAIANGMALYGGLRPFVATFLVFCDYMRPAIRLAALMKLPIVYVFTHDSIAVGEDGPTHQPVEHLVSLRIIPNLSVIRPGDAHETACAWQEAIRRRSGPTALLLTRQKLPVQPPPPQGAVSRGAYIKVESASGSPEVVLVATGSEVALALAAREILQTEGISTRVVSAPSFNLFADQDETYQRQVLGPRHALKVAIEMGRGQGWHRWIGNGEMIVLPRFGASAPADTVMANLGFSPTAVAERVRLALGKRRPSPLVITDNPLRNKVDELRRQLQEMDFSSRLAARDVTLWGAQSSNESARRLGWLDVPTRSQGEIACLEKLVASLTDEGINTLYLVGMGGSSLAPHVLREIGGNPSGRELVVLDTTDPDYVTSVLDTIVPEKSAVVIVSKSGTTAESSALLEIFWKLFGERLGQTPGERFIAITEPQTALAHLATERGFRAVLSHPVDIGGRYSALSVVGILPALWLGLDAEALLTSAAKALAGPFDGHPAVEMGVHWVATTENGWGKLVWCASPALWPLGAWVEQLVAESTGKQGRGILPLLSPKQSNKLTRWPGSSYFAPRFVDEKPDGQTLRLLKQGIGVVEWLLDRDALGEAFAALELATVTAGVLLGVNPFDQPDVQRAKERSNTLSASDLSYPNVALDAGKQLKEHCSGLGGDEVIVLLAYLPDTKSAHGNLLTLADRISDYLQVPVASSFGPRYLHSTGQLFKGGPKGIIPIVLTSQPGRDIQIPGQSHTLGQLRFAQAIGDIQAMQEVGRRVLHLHLGKNALDVVARLTEEFN